MRQWGPTLPSMTASFSHRWKLGFTVRPANALGNIEHDIDPTGSQALIDILIGFDEHHLIPLGRYSVTSCVDRLQTVIPRRSIKKRLPKHLPGNTIVDQCDLQSCLPRLCGYDTEQRMPLTHQTIPDRTRTPILFENSGRYKEPPGSGL